MKDIDIKKSLREIVYREENDNHIDYIDLAKGICILMVVSYHCDYGDFLYSNDIVNSFFFSFRMPLYFFLSGIFISFKYGYRNFFKKKINRLIIPFIFFYFTSSVVNEFITPREVPSMFEFLLTETKNNFWNTPIWFLISLITTYCMYMTIHKFISKNIYLILILSIIIGIGGFSLSYKSINIPFFLDTSMTCFPFVVFGGIMRNKYHLLDNISKIRCVVFSSISFFFVFLFCNGNQLFYENKYDCNLIELYLCGFFGSVGLVYFSKILNYVPIINYIGRYSIIVLGFHKIFILRPILLRITDLPISIVVLLSLLLSVICCIIMIYICRRYLPSMVAQKDLLFKSDL